MGDIVDGEIVLTEEEARKLLEIRLTSRAAYYYPDMDPKKALAIFLLVRPDLDSPEAAPSRRAQMSSRQ